MDSADEPRPATREEREKAEAVVREAFVAYLPDMDRPPAPMLADLAPRIDAGEVWVAGRPVAGVCCLTARPHALEIEILAVSPTAQGRGLGRLLLDQAEREARRAGYDRLVLSTNEVMTRSASVYRHVGFVEVDRRIEDGYRRIFLERPLG